MSPRRRKILFLKYFLFLFKHTELGRMVYGVAIHENNLHIPIVKYFLVKNLFLINIVVTC